MKKILTGIAMMLCALPLAAQFSGAGDGTAASPYLITDAYQLAEVSNSLYACYRLENDIDLSEWIADNNPEEGWTPIGKDSEFFSGSFDGNGKTISGLFIDRPSTKFVGLFKKLLSSASIHDLNVQGAQVNGGEYCGIVAGYSESYNLARITVGNSQLSSDSDLLGGVVGSIYVSNGSLRNNVSELIVHDCTIAASGSSSTGIGGVAGKTSNVGFTGCHALHCTVSGNRGVGGIVGQINNNATNYATYTDIMKCSASGSVSGDWKVGGICGTIIVSQTVYNSYSYVNVCDNKSECEVSASSTDVAGIIGSLYSGYGSYITLNVKRNLAGGSVSGKSEVCGVLYSSYETTSANIKVSNNVVMASELAGTTAVPLRVSNIVYCSDNRAWNGMKVTKNGEAQTVKDDIFNGSKYGAGTLQRRATYEGMEFDFSETWGIDEGKGYPYLLAVKLFEESLEQSGEDIATGTGTYCGVSASGTVFDLQGRKHAAPANGIYVINGKKRVVK